MNLAGIRRRGAEEARLFGLAVGFLTRLPVPCGRVDEGQMASCRRYFGLVGLLLGLLATLFYTVISNVLPTWVAATATLTALIILTGGLHEDGLADTADGIGGGWTAERRLEIMKDSRLGSYGALALVCAFSLRLGLLVTLAAEPGAIAVGLILGASLSRIAATSMISLLPYARLERSKVVALSTAQSRFDLCLLIGSGVLFALLLSGFFSTLLLLLALAALLALLREWFKRRIGGFTGDTLGATQQGAEILIYLVLAIRLGGT
ncbi:adenosylcobinamide-GDP ribazoletransferase [Halotalea alkalilenta]|uniref:adenosylcobinamide-GDP ribazoletransferase n=1 Tax=Halotalea alkalilenta TaxID=376489 RepID=UPI0005BB920D|nr:adenosylcobinamide-GDP ribazoletransferase [Halotalea alkalilenta]